LAAFAIAAQFSLPTNDWVEVVSNDCGQQVMADGLKLFHAIIWLRDSESLGLRVQVSAANASEARKLLETEYGEGDVYYLHNEEEANRPR
jgi:cystathionine beta-lyase/cystathionine gamma-synthase